MEEASSDGSWLPFVVVFVLVAIRVIFYGQGETPVRIRRWFQLQVSKYAINLNRTLCGAALRRRQHEQGFALLLYAMILTPIQSLRHITESQASQTAWISR